MEQEKCADEACATYKAKLDECNDRVGSLIIISTFILVFDIDGVITLKDIICKTCHYSWPG